MTSKTLKLSIMLIISSFNIFAAAIRTTCELRCNSDLPKLHANIDEKIKQRGGVDVLKGEGNEKRTLLMSYGEGFSPCLNAIKYLIEQKNADLNVLDTYIEPRPFLIYPAYYGHADIVEYIASLGKKIDTKQARHWANGGLGVTHNDKDKLNRILAALDKIDKH